MEAVVVRIFFISFLDLFAVSLLLPLMSTRLKALGASHFLMGCMTSIYALTQLICGPVIGSWSDRIGRKNILCFSLLAVSCCYTMLGLLDSLLLILLIRATLGIFKHTQTLIRTIITDKVPAFRQNSVFGYLKAIAGISFTVGPIVSGHLSELENGFSYVCYLVGALFVLNSALAYFFLDDSPDDNIKRDSETGKPGGSIMDAIRDLTKVDWPIYWDIFTLKFLADFAAGAFHNNYGLKLREKYELSHKMAGYTISVQSFAGVLAGLFVDRVNERFYSDDVFYKRRNLHGYAALAIIYLGIAVTTHASVFMLWTMLLRSLQMFLRIVLGEMTIRRCPESQRGSLIGTTNSISNIARLLAPLLAGLLEDGWGTNSSNVLAAATATCGVVVSLRLRKERQKIS